MVCMERQSFLNKLHTYCIVYSMYISILLLYIEGTSLWNEQQTDTYYYTVYSTYVYGMKNNHKLNENDKYDINKLK